MTSPYFAGRRGIRSRCTRCARSSTCHSPPGTCHAFASRGSRRTPRPPSNEDGAPAGDRLVPARGECVLKAQARPPDPRITSIAMPRSSWDQERSAVSAGAPRLCARARQARSPNDRPKAWVTHAMSQDGLHEPQAEPRATPVCCASIRGWWVWPILTDLPYENPLAPGRTWPLPPRRCAGRGHA